MGSYRHRIYRINFCKYTIENIRCPNKLKNGYDYTENFDGVISKLGENKIYFNLKFVSGTGGAQTRTLREVYHFIHFQLCILEKYDNIFFINILDGDTSFKNMNKFEYLLESKKEKNNKIYVGDFKSFINSQYYSNFQEYIV